MSTVRRLTARLLGCVRQGPKLPAPPSDVRCVFICGGYVALPSQVQVHATGAAQLADAPSVQPKVASLET